ncbi:hypothetical protein E8D34_16935 [Nocardioides sp. GY 10113]|uniref:hypothetical protein n=1 Tax=Nocardioides sp. GY 10113 TaxID=2569761 RepID=UPI0010A77A3E|nr:hypothetical protein [Nocardioides sp. GY 10113]TIC82502.1 hypothetical protein E8D34_16935 [Nocardioides sp. GY 10113]
MASVRGPALRWVLPGLACLLLSYGAVSGTLADWVRGSITSSAALKTAQGVVLSVTAQGKGLACHSSDSADNNNVTCAINLYRANDASPLQPGTGNASVTEVTFRNAGSASASQFSVQIGSCGQSPAAGSTITQTATNGGANVVRNDLPVRANLCGAPSTGSPYYQLAGEPELRVAMSCRTGSTWTTGATVTALEVPTAVPTAVVGTRTWGTAGSGAIAPGSTWTCRITVLRSANAAPSMAGGYAAQSLQFSLS